MKKHTQTSMYRDIYTCMHPPWNASFQNEFLTNFQNLKHVQTFQNIKQNSNILAVCS